MPASAQKIVATVENFMADVVEASNTKPVLVDFWAPWCGPCRTLMPLLDRIADDYEGRFILAKVNTEEQPQLASHFQIRSIPTVLLIHQGEVVDQFVGLQPEPAIKALLDRYVTPAGEMVEPVAAAPAPDRPGDLAARLLDQRDAEGAATAIEALAATQPDHPRLGALRGDSHSSRSPMPSRTSWRSGLLSRPTPPTQRHGMRWRRTTRWPAITGRPWPSGWN